jgi:hypothetical protein
LKEKESVLKLKRAQHLQKVDEVAQRRYKFQFERAKFDIAKSFKWSLVRKKRAEMLIQREYYF